MVIIFTIIIYIYLLLLNNNCFIVVYVGVSREHHTDVSLSIRAYVN